MHKQSKLTSPTLHITLFELSKITSQQSNLQVSSTIFQNKGAKKHQQLGFLLMYVRQLYVICEDKSTDKNIPTKQKP